MIIYIINPSGLHDENGVWQRAKGLEYKKLRKEVEQELNALTDNNGMKPLEKICSWEEAEKEFRLPAERSGDLIIANHPGYGWNEKLTDDGAVFSKPLKTGYKQSIITENNPAMWTPFIVTGPGVKKGNFLGDTPLNMVDQYPTIMKLLNKKTSKLVQGQPIDGIFE